MTIFKLLHPRQKCDDCGQVLASAVIDIGNPDYGRRGIRLALCSGCLGVLEKLVGDHEHPVVH